MVKPQSIVQFERLYLASFMMGIISTIQNWTVRERMLERNADTVDLSWLAPAVTAAGVVIAIALWYFVARRGALVAKWVVTAFAAWGAVLIAMLGYGLVAGRGQVVNLLVGIAQNMLYILAAATLYRPDARRWFGEGAVA